MSKKALGRGIEALLKTAGEDRNVSAVNEVSPDSLSANPYQPRQDFDEDNLNELADSIKQKGILQPVLVEPAGEGKYIIIAGERRVRAAKIAGLKRIPVIVKQFSDEEKLEIALIENIQREDLSPIEEAYAYKRLIDISGLNQEEIAGKVGRKRSTVANALRLLKLPASIQDALGRGRITSGHARALLMIGDKEKQENLFQRILKQGLSVRQSEALASQKKAENNKERKNISPELKEIEQRLMDVLGTKIVIKGNDSRGRIEISYFSLDDLNRVIDLIT
ncbi:MAG: ParB/RepB/Spo0J family partition protein [Spirochaetes bacterium]|nr:ParB/RepB/Spo0J family partition protein [Spirochaetota bacterium]